jgi:hypothetical protein
MDFLHREGGAERFVVVGLCSGAYLGFYTGVADARVAGEILINPQTFHFTEGDSLEIKMRRSYKSTRFYKRAIFQTDTWVRALRGDVNLRGVLGVIGERLKERATAQLSRSASRLRNGTIKESDVTRAFQKLVGRGGDALLVYSAEDGGLDELEKQMGPSARRMQEKKGFSIEIVEGPDHTFTPLWSQRRLKEIVVGHVEARFG